MIQYVEMRFKLGDSMTLEEQYKLSCYEELTSLDQHDNILLVRDIKTNEIYVKKILDTFHGEVYRTLQQASILGIPRLYEIFEENQQLIIIEEYIAGESLEKKLERGVLSQEATLDYIYQLCDILYLLHGLQPQVVHRDIKPSNIMITRENKICLIDFNAARLYQENVNEDTQLIGTQEYAAPEQYGFRQTDARTDVYALGVVLNQMLTGKLPKEEIAKGFLGNVIRTCTKMDPEHRYQTIEQMKKACNPKRRIIKKEGKKSISFVPPGFRTRTPWKMILSVFGYICMFFIVCTMEVMDANQKIVTDTTRINVNRMFFMLIALSYILIPMNYLNWQGRIPWLKKANTLLRGLVSFGVMFLVSMALGVVLVIVESVFW